MQGARGPVQAVFCENWVVYHYWSVLNHRWEMTVLELYNTAHEDVQIQDLLFGGSRNETLSSSQPVPIEVTRGLDRGCALSSAQGICGFRSVQRRNSWTRKRRKHPLATCAHLPIAVRPAVTQGFR